RDLKEMGFTQVMLDWPNLHQAAAEAGLQFVLAHWWNQKSSSEEISAAVERARQTDSQKLIGFSVMDEPERNSPETPFGFYIDLYEKLLPEFRRDLPNTRIEISHWGPLASWTEEHYEYFSFLYEAADVMRIMPYPDLREGPLDEVFFMIQRTQRLMELAGRKIPLVVILQTWVLPPENKLPTVDELRVMTYLAMLSGAETVSYFDYNLEVWNQTSGFSAGFRDLMQEVTAFRRRHQDDDVVSTMSADGILTSTLSARTGRVMQLTINTNRIRAGDLSPLEIRTSVALPETATPCRPECHCVAACPPSVCVADACCAVSPFPPWTAYGPENIVVGRCSSPGGRSSAPVACGSSTQCCGSVVSTPSSRVRYQRFHSPTCCPETRPLHRSRRR
ncbi:MAG: hypothetical protein KDA89_02085, partial [Planctomycetaceae bacterium]|nr:hypothetical protein [Planctomycetaceae bacterium]